MIATQKPIEYSYFQFDGDFMYSNGEYYVPKWAVEALNNGDFYFGSVNRDSPPCDLFLVVWHNGIRMDVLVEPGDYIVRDPWGSIYACKAEYFLNEFNT